MNLETKITIYKFTPQLFTLTHKNGNDLSENDRRKSEFVHRLNISHLKCYH